MTKIFSKLFLLLLLISYNFLDASKIKKKLEKNKLETETETKGIITGALIGFAAGKILGAATKALGENTKLSGVLEFLGLYDPSEQIIAEKVKNIEKKVNEIGMKVMDIKRKVENNNIEHIMFNRNLNIHQYLYSADSVFLMAEDIKNKNSTIDDDVLSDKLIHEISIWGKIHADDVEKLIRTMIDKQNHYPKTYYDYAKIALNENQANEYVLRLIVEDVDCIYKNVLLSIAYWKIQHDYYDEEIVELFNDAMDYYSNENSKYAKKVNNAELMM